MSEHLTDSELTDLLAEAGDLEDFVPHVLHLVTCTVCRDRFEQDRAQDVSLLARRVFGRTELPPVPRRRGETTVWRGLLDRCLPKIDRALSEQREAETLWNRAASLPAGRQLLEITNRRRFHTLGFVYRILGEVEKRQKRDPREAEAWCELALRVVERLPEERYGTRPLQDVLARAYALWGNCRRIYNDLAAANRHFRKAELHLSQGSGEPLEQAKLHCLEASLRRDQRRFEEARELLRLAADVYRSVRDPRRLAGVIVQQAMICRDEGDPEVAVETLEGLLQEANPDELSDEMRLLVELNLTTYLAEAGRVDEASHRLPILRRQVAETNQDRLDHRMRFDWLEAIIRERQGRSESAEALYRKAQAGFLAEGMAYDAAVVSLDLAALYLDQGRCNEAARLARELSPLLWEVDFHREAVAALMVFQKAALQETATGRYAREVSQTLQRLRGRPASPSNTH